MVRRGRTLQGTLMTGVNALDQGASEGLKRNRRGWRYIRNRLPADGLPR
jgi:hypothetical protein